jgi:hypothetical protein
MLRPFARLQILMVWCFILMSSALLGFLSLPGQARAHELRPAVAEVSVNEDRIEISLRLAVETLLAGIDQSQVADTDEAPEAEVYDRLRGLPDRALAQMVETRFSDISAGILLEGAGPLRLASVDVIAEPDLELARDTVVSMSAELPPGTAPVSLGWAARNGGLVVRHGEGPNAYAAFLQGGEVSAPLPRSGVVEESTGAVFLRFVVEGFEHIIPKGVDHILFVLGLFLFSLAWRPLLAQVTAFTLAHTVTLGLATLSIITIPPAQMWLVEALIAISIAYVAIENILRPKLGWWRILVVFGFGLLHGLGFASVLGDLGLAQGQFILSLIAFNIGVELGQLAVIAAAFVLFALPLGRSAIYRRVVVIPGSVAIAFVGLWWAFERSFM